MKKQFFSFLICCFLLVAMSVPIFGQTTNRFYYVRADGDDENNGRSETTPLKTLEKALSLSSQGAIKTIMVIGKIEVDVIGYWQVSTDAEIVITGKENASEEEKAVFDSVKIMGDKINLRFENITITSTHSDYALSIWGASIKIGTGVKISSHRDTNSENSSITSSHGVSLYTGATFVMDDGEISRNTNSGVFLETGCTFIMNGGIISQNTAHNDRNWWTNSGAGILNGGTAVINGGIITNNSAKYGGGIFNNGTLTINGGSITKNKAEYGAGIYHGNGKLIIEKGSITANESDFVGGGLYVKKGKSFTYKGNVISGNSAGDGEGDDIFIQQ
jgi:hypothetical protein